MQYGSLVSYVCSDPRKYIKVVGGSEVTPQLTSQCQWNKTWSLDGGTLECEIHHCAHPHLHPGSHPPPPPGHNLSLVHRPDITLEGLGDMAVEETLLELGNLSLVEQLTESLESLEQSLVELGNLSLGGLGNLSLPLPLPVNLSLVDSWLVEFGEKITYWCDAGTFIETSDPLEVEPTIDSIEVECKGPEGTYKTPSTWPNCTQTINCGLPPAKPSDGWINAVPGFNGSVTWLFGALNGSNTYNTTVEYKCAEGSQFDTDSDGVGDTVALTARCRWDKQWSPPSLPDCRVTDCTEPPSIPADTYLEEVTDQWTPVESSKLYQCQGSNESRHTRFWESDRAKTTFKILCKLDGSFQFDEQRSSWPTCVEDILCTKLPPAIPSHPEYTLPAYDGTVTSTSLLYPELERIETLFTSATNRSDLPRNYLANLTYSCGAAREFFIGSTELAEQTMTCLWDKTWSPSNQLFGACDWAACLKPPAPPASTNLRVTDWDGQPVRFGDRVHFVCQRGTRFEEDLEQLDVTFTCQDGTVEGAEKGFFDVPEDEEDWPRCVQATLCPDPPEPHLDGKRDWIPKVFEVENSSACTEAGKFLNLKCHSFYNIYVTAGTFGRLVNNKKKICNGDEQDDSQEPSSNCTDSQAILSHARDSCHGRSSCSVAVPPDFIDLHPDCDGLKREVNVEYVCGG